MGSVGVAAITEQAEYLPRLNEFGSNSWLVPSSIGRELRLVSARL